MASQLHLIPMPREVRPTTALSIPQGVRIIPTSEIDDQFAASDFARSLAAREIPATIGTAGDSSFTVELLRTSTPAAQSRLAAAHLAFEPALQSEGYILITTGNAVTIIAASSEGVFYGLQTLKQMISGGSLLATLNGAVIRDWPAMRYRGIQDDLSRGPVPTLEFQKHQIQVFAAYKLNVLSLYFEHNLSYSADPLPAPPGGSLTPTDVTTLVAFAAPYHVTIVPEQESFGHLHNMLMWEQYQPLAETSHGAVLAPGQPGSLELINRMFSQLALQFPSPFLHIGGDETVELGTGQTQSAVDTRGLGPVYLDFLQQINTTLTPLHRRLLFWGDIATHEAQHDPTLLAGLPAAFKQNMIAVPWDYNPQPRGFSRFIKPFTDAGIETWVSPGVNSWLRVYPNYGMALANIQGFARDGQAAGSTGLLNTIWVDDGEGLFNSDWYGVLFGAACAWQPGESSIDQFQQNYGRVFHGDTTGDINQAQQELITDSSLLRDTAKLGDYNNSLFWLDPFSKEGLSTADKIRPYTHDLRLHAERAITLIAQARAAATYSGVPLREPDAIDALELGARRMDFIGLKFQLSDEMSSLYALALAQQSDPAKHRWVNNYISEISGTNGRLQDLRNSYSLLGDLYHQAWLRSNRPYWYSNISALYELNTQLWISRADHFHAATHPWDATHPLPSADAAGIPPPPPAAAPVH